MSEEALTPSEIMVLLVLMAEADEISNPVLAQRYGITLTGKTRAKLNDLKLVESRKQGRALVHLLTEPGWCRLITEIGKGVKAPQRSGWTGGACLALLAGIQRHLDRENKKYADIFQAGAAPEAVVPEATTSKATEPFTPPPSPPEPSSAPDVQARIRAAYAELAREPGDWVSLTRLRTLLADVARAEVDAALRLMNRMSDVAIAPASNQKALTDTDREAAVIIGDEDKHLLWIGAR